MTAMKNTIKRFLLGILSSALLAVGLVRAAGHLDPMNHSLPAADAGVHGTAPSTSTECDVVSNVR